VSSDNLTETILLQTKLKNPSFWLRVAAPFFASKPMFDTIGDEKEAFTTAARIYKYGDDRVLTFIKMEEDVLYNWYQLRRGSLKRLIEQNEDIASEENLSFAEKRVAQYLRMSEDDTSTMLLPGTVDELTVAKKYLEEVLDARARIERYRAELDGIMHDIANRPKDDTPFQRFSWLCWAIVNIKKIKRIAETFE